MGQRGPKSKAEVMAPVPTVLPRRPEAPAHLDDVGQFRWREIVNEMPVDRLRASDLVLLADLIKTEQYARECDQNIAAHGQVIGPGVQINPAVLLREKHMRIIVALQRALRLCPSMRMRQDAGSLPTKKPANKPWEA